MPNWIKLLLILLAVGIVVTGIGKCLIYIRHKVHLVKITCIGTNEKYEVGKCWDCQEAYWAEKLGFNHFLGKIDEISFEKARAMAGDHIIYQAEHCIPK